MTSELWLSTWPAIEGVANHLWQSTIFAVAAALLTLVLRHNRAQIRYWLWLAASLKFLFPFAALVALGSQFSWQSSTPIVSSEMSVVIDAVSQPFSRPEVLAVATVPAAPSASVTSTALFALFAIWLAGCASILITWLVRWRRIAAAVRRGLPIEEGREVEMLRRLEHAAGLGTPIAFVLSDASLEPGVFGIRTPTLLWPRSIGERLDDAHVEAILTHEVSHVRRRDNLAAAIHMVVQAVFWFHPVVWWLGARLVDERERACDEAVIGLGSEPQVYAESILKTCRFCVESPLACVAGVTGSDLKKRIELIMRNDVGAALNRSRQLLIAAAAVLSIATPLAVGALNAPRLRAQSPATATDNPTFEVASLKPNKSGDGRMQIGVHPGGRYTATNMPLRGLIQNAYQLQPFQLVDAPAWITDRFDIVAKGEPEEPGHGALFAARQGPNRNQLMLRALLADRFKLKVHTESREMPVYALTLARGDGRLGPQLKRAAVDCGAMGAARGRGPAPVPAPGAPDARRPEGVLPPDAMRCGIRIGPGNIAAGGVVLPQFANMLAILAGRIVIDRTGLAGNFDIDLQITPEQMPAFGPGGPPPGAPPIDPNGPSIFNAVQEQLGLRLESTKGPVDVLVIDHVEQPTED